MSVLEQDAERSAGAGAAARWQMNRVGILNFWYYDEDEFQLEEGRLILRGANGSGKSVTMQSFLPLVLDGDKRAHRLDPFGSRDRRIEYYLLGEEDGGKTDATGYLWMEFRHGATGTFKTVGIGLRARRNAAQVQFWGFLLEDGRRIGRDFWLYNRKQWLEDNKKTKMPLDRRELETEIKRGGGQVVFDQKSYQDMVNKHIFGFADTDAYQDLLQLMIQLRSPKLSKDFKPTAIYEILHQALPPLAEDELRPLSEVLEDMDSMADRLDELRRHRGELSKLQERYDFYNKHNLYARSLALLNAEADHEGMASRVRSSQAELEQAEREKTVRMEEKAVVQQRLQEIAAEREVLEKHEAIGKQREYESVSEALKVTENQMARSKDRQDKLHLRQEQFKRNQEEAAAARDGAEREQRDLLAELEALAGDMEFADHSVYHGQWAKEAPVDDAWREPWRRDIRQHREAVERALVKAAQEREAAALTKERELELGEASRMRDESEREQASREKRLEACKESLKNDIFMWRQGLGQLVFDDEAIRDTFGAIAEFGSGQSSLEPIRKALLRSYESGVESVMARRLELSRQREEITAERSRLHEEKQSWEQSKEPEPPRSEARAASRGKERQGAPLYAVIDFKPGVADGTRVRIEDALERSGLLDAWISPDGKIDDSGAGGEEAWIVPRPIEFGFTLGDLLVPDLPEGSGLASATVEAALRSFLWDEAGGIDLDDDWSGIIAADGSYRLGPLAGRSHVKERAQYIGRETRRRTRLLEIERLEEAIRLLDGLLEDANARMAALDADGRQLADERERFPSGSDLADELRELDSARYKLQAAARQEERALERYKAKHAEWRETQRELYELTRGWTRLKREKELADAVSLIRDYDGLLSELHSVWRQYRSACASWERTTEELATTVLEQEDEAALLDELDERRRNQRAQAETLRRLIEDLGLADVARNLAALREEQSRLQQSGRGLDKLLDELKDAVSTKKARLEMLGEQVGALQAQLERETGQWITEWNLGLVEESRGQALQEDETAQRAMACAKEVRRSFESLFVGRNIENITNRLLEQYNAARMLLTEYVVESVVDEISGRILLWSMRDPHKPLTPQALLEELEANEREQSALLSEKDRQLYEEIILRSVGKAIRQRIHRAEQWVREMNKLMEERDTSSGLRLKLEWGPKASAAERQLDAADLVGLLKRDSHLLREDEIDAMIQHFRSQIASAKQAAQDEQESLRQHLYRMLDYRSWFRFELKYKKGEQSGYRPLTDARFNVLSGGEKAMAMYIPLFAATWSRYSDARADAPRLISLDEAFAGVDEENMRDMFKLLTDMGFDYMMTSQVLWGCFDTVPRLSIYEIYRPKDVDFVTLFRYRWNGKRKEYVEGGEQA